MSNMSYCRFRNTLKDLADCQEALQQEGVRSIDDEDELRAAHTLIAMCGEIHRDFGEEEE